jgi:hypothetical protein
MAMDRCTNWHPSALRCTSERDACWAIGVGSTSLSERSARDSSVWPSIAQIAGHMLDAIFIDTLNMDLERLQRVNQTLASVRENTGWGPVPN